MLGVATGRLVVRRGSVADRGHQPYRTLSGMCRSIKTLRRPETAATTGEIEAAARQFVRKVSGYRAPSARNQVAFDAAIEEVSAASRRLLEALAVEVEEGPDRWTPRPSALRIRAGVSAGAAEAPIARG